MPVLSNTLSHIYRHELFKNSSWGIASQLFQTFLISVFFIIIARKYSTDEFAKYVIATVLYQIVAAVSPLGLGQWFIRELAGTNDREHLIGRFFKLQLYSGIVFYFINVALAALLYGDSTIRLLAILFGVNVIFDNAINALKSLNIADFEQKKTFIILTVDALLRVTSACLLFLFPFSLITLAIMLLIIRASTLNLFLRFGSSSIVNVKALWQYRVSWADTRTLLYLNWPWLILGGVSILNWRIANIIIASTLTFADLANYEISYKVFSIAQLLPVVVLTSLFPFLIKLYNQGDEERFQGFYTQVYLFTFLFGLLAYSFTYSFADLIVPFAFGSKYPVAALYTKQIFLTMIVFPTAFLQANVLFAMKLEKVDMWLNIMLLLVNAAMCVIGLHYVKSLVVVNVALCTSFVIFHLLQDVLLIRKRTSSLKQVLGFHIGSVIFVSSYVLLARTFSSPFVFVIYWIGIMSLLLSLRKNRGMRRRFPLSGLVNGGVENRLRVRAKG